jgi:DMSO/TMAO reductase YedYZ molybdopterin-dependent catalytic subunit
VSQPGALSKDGANSDKSSHIGRRTVLGVTALGAAGVAFGTAVDNKVGRTLTSISNALGGLPIPGADAFRLYTVTGAYPSIDAAHYRLTVDGLVDKRLSLSLADLKAMPRTSFTHYFQCVTGWRVPNVHWAGVTLADVLQAAGVKAEAKALRFFSGDGVYTESLTLEQARLPQVIVADEMLGDTVTVEHGGPVRLYVAPMYGYKSIKWLDRIEVVTDVIPGYWEDNGYPVDAWIGGVQ